MSKKKVDKNLSTEEKFKEAARVVFTKKGYAATKTRDIAQEAGLNLALLNYYFRSKEKLFEIIMAEKVVQLFNFIAPSLNDPDTTLQEKIEIIAERYIEMLIKNPDLPLFVLGEIRTNPGRFAKSIKLRSFIMESQFFKQIAMQKPGINPIQLFISFMAMLVFPFVMKPVLQEAGTLDQELFNTLMLERKKMIPLWMKMMLE